MLIDTHAHLHDKAFDADLEGVLERMRSTGVLTAVTVGCDLEDSRRALNTAQQYGLYCSVGVHPHEAKDAPSNIGVAFAPILAAGCVVAIGETGLDYYYDNSPRDVQQRILREQIRVARDTGKPVIFHHRDAFDDFIAILHDEWRPGMRGVIHCFTGDTAQAKAYVERFGMFLGVGGVITFKSAGIIRDAVLSVGPQHVVLETDCPYLAPVPHRGERNEPAYVAQTARRLAEIFSMSAERVAQITTKNAETLFGIRAALPRG